MPSEEQNFEVGEEYRCEEGTVVGNLNATHDRKDCELGLMHFEEGEREMKWNYMVRHTREQN